jgi:protein-disulfide isomerase
VKQVLARYPEQVRLVYRHYPLESIHPNARGAAEASACAAEQGKFWEYHDLLFANGKKLGAENLAVYAEQAGLDTDAFQACVDEERFRSVVDRDIAAARAAGVSGTPTFFINGRALGGAQPLDEFVRVIEDELQRSGSSS